MAWAIVDEQTKTQAPGSGPLAIGQVIAGRYRIVEEFGCTASAWFYRASYEPVPVLQFVIRLLRPELHERPELVESFIHEARVAMDVESENIVRYRGGSRTEQGYHFIVREFVHGASLAHLMVEGFRPTLAEVERYALGMTRAFRDAHAAGHVLGVVTASDILVHERDVVSYRDIRSACAGVQPGTLIPDMVEVTSYTRPFIAPELRGAAFATRSGDVYTLGVLLAFLVLGRIPRSTTDRADMLAFDRPGVRELVPVVVKACSPSPADRYVSVEEVELAVRERCSAGTRRRARTLQHAHEQAVAGRHVSLPDAGAPGSEPVVFASRSSADRRGRVISMHEQEIQRRLHMLNQLDLAGEDAPLAPVQQLNLVAPGRSALVREPEIEHGAAADHGAVAGHGAAAEHGAAADHGAAAEHGAAADHGATTEHGVAVDRGRDMDSATRIAADGGDPS